MPKQTHTIKPDPRTPDSDDAAGSTPGATPSTGTPLEVPPKPGTGSRESRDKAYGPGGAPAVGGGATDIDTPTPIDDMLNGPDETGERPNGPTGTPSL